ncbi:MAG: hypothetical protein KDE27_15045, partial [Planctomycetes bacterium]|nr:hypothetical protein [Planctomycetota bacterium]
ELTVAGDGTNAIEVTEGAVTFDFDGRVVFVPAGAATKVTAKGPSTPLFTDCSAELRRAVGLFDRATMAGESGMREKGVYAVVQAVREPRDTLVLWHLLRDPDPLLREQAAAALLDLAGPPPDDPIVLDPPTWDPAVWLAWLRLGAWRPAK